LPILPATFRFLDPPLHEFLPADHAQQSELANKLGVAVEQIARRVHELHEFNPMLGHRGCRLGIVYPEISEMQARAIFEAAAEVQGKDIKVRPEIMIPLVGFPRELKLQIEIVRRVAEKVAKEKKSKFRYLVGRMIEIPRDLGRKTRPDIKLGICGEHGGEPTSVKFCHRLGLDYVSCSPFRIPIARLAAAQAALEKQVT